MASLLVLAALITNVSQPNLIDKSLVPIQLTQQSITPQIRRSFIQVKFKEMSSDNVPIFEITNLTKRDIDNIRGSFTVEDTSGKYLFASGFTDLFTGNIFLKAGETKKFEIFGLSKRIELVQLIKKSPETIQVFFDAKDIRYIDGTIENSLY